MPYLFAATLFLSAALLFWVEPMVGKMVLPLLGGSPAVWNTCLVFFQTALLAGYLYAHAASTWLGHRAQAVLHLALLGAAALVLPVTVSEELVRDLPADSDPVPWLLRLLLVGVGLPFVVIAGSAPLLQKWFTATRHVEGRDPYFLYAASNLGSMVALLGYPLLLEPGFRLATQSVLWASGYGLLVLLTAGCALAAWRSAPADGAAELSEEKGEQPTAGRRGRWLLLAAVPSTLLLAVTNHVTTDLAAVPLLWVVPLALYLLSFILVFSRREWLPHAALVRVLPFVVLGVGFLLADDTGLGSWQLVPVHWLALFVVAMVFHGELARDRPPPRYLTAFYLWVALGGTLGGLANVFAAPLVFQARALEYPLALLLACLLTPALPTAGAARLLDVVGPCAVGLLTLIMAVSMNSSAEAAPSLAPLAAFGAVVGLGLAFRSRPYFFLLPIGAALLVGFEYQPDTTRVLHAERNFFGLLTVEDNRDRTFRILSHGTTQHGKQPLDADGQPLHDCEPTGYYHRSGPMGQVFEQSRADTALPRRVAVIGLGNGGLASYARAGEAWTFYEIDPAVERIARDPHWFTYLADSERRGATVDVVLGDARLRLRDAQEHGYGLIIQDAFTSDAVPTHLITRQALQVYRAKLAPGGLLVFHVSNRYLELRPVLADLADDAGMVSAGWYDRAGADEKKKGKNDSSWVVLAGRAEDLGRLGRSPWQRLAGVPGRRVWEDDYSNLVQVFRFGRRD